MQIVNHEINDTKIAEIVSDNMVIQSAEDGLNLLGDMYFQGFESIVLHEKNIHPDFFDLKNGMAGEILQKFSTYRVRLAIVGDFQSLTGKSIRDFMYESNQNKHINFLPGLADALQILSIKQ